MNPSNFCLNDSQMALSKHPTEELLTGRVVPFLILFGLSGNIVNLTVLLAPGMRTRSNVMLAALAVCDVVFLLPHSMANFRVFAFSYTFRVLYLPSKMVLLTILNWASAAAIWLVLAICVERVLGIRYPLEARNRWRSFLLRPLVLLPLLSFGTALVTFYHNFTQQCVYRTFCNGTQPASVCRYTDAESWFHNTTNPNPLWLRLYVRWSPDFNALFVIFVPILLVAVSNILLIHTLRQRQRFFTPSGGQQSASQMRTEQKVTITVCAIVTCFTITQVTPSPLSLPFQGPSALFALFKRVPVTSFEHNIRIIVTTLVVVGKALNFVLFCLSSSTFRHRLLTTTRGRLLRRQATQASRRYSMNTCETSFSSAPSAIVELARKMAARSPHTSLAGRRSKSLMAAPPGSRFRRSEASEASLLPMRVL